MSRRTRVYSLVAVALVAAIALAGFTIVRPFSSQAKPTSKATVSWDAQHAVHDLHSPLSDHERALR